MENFLGINGTVMVVSRNHFRPIIFTSPVIAYRFRNILQTLNFNLSIRCLHCEYLTVAIPSHGPALALDSAAPHLLVRSHLHLLRRLRNQPHHDKVLQFCLSYRFLDGSAQHPLRS